MARSKLSGAFILLLLQYSCRGSLGSDDGEDGERLIGWRGESYKANSSSGNTQERWIETVSWTPRAFVYHGFLSHEECDHLVQLAIKRLERSMVVSETGDVFDPIRTSYSASITYGETTTVKEVEERIARWTHLPVAHGEPIEVLRYQNGQKYDAHWDWFDEKEMTDKTTGNRMATVLMYLSDVEPGAGGETALPLAYPIDPDLQAIEGRGYSECAARQGISIKPRKGDVLLFWDMDLDGKSTDRHALHASCPTTKGEKWTATKWIHSTPYS